MPRSIAQLRDQFNHLADEYDRLTTETKQAQQAMYEALWEYRDHPDAPKAQVKCRHGHITTVRLNPDGSLESRTCGKDVENTGMMGPDSEPCCAYVERLSTGREVA